MVRRRLDAELVRRGLAMDEDEARSAVRAGAVTVEGSTVTNEASLVAPGEAVGLETSGRRFASRAGEKLDFAIERFGVNVSGADALDAGAASGGFTDCLIHRGAARVAAVDVAYGELAWDLRNDPRVSLLERTNVRQLTRDDLPFPPNLVVADLSFISLASVVASLVEVAAPDAIFLLLVKPQFEAARPSVEPGGVVRDPAVWRAAIDSVVAACETNGAGVSGVIASPLRGPAGNVEFFVHAVRGGRAGEAALDSAIAEGARVIAEEEE
jgi:23S rRNA (cytidine1920-2'-O)/16S rRNA (cytidine1409-2'-O)-methyltransferase